MRFLQFLIINLLIGCSFNNERSVKDHSMYWHKNSAEYKALCLQAYNIAKKKLELELSKYYEKPLAIIADLDETIFDNTPYNEMLIKENKSYNQENWSEWVNKQIATAIPGSLDFFNHAKSLGIEIIYLSNRRIENYEPTKENLISLGFPFNEKTLMLLRDETTDKTKRRNSLSKYEIIMLIGDNLSDFDSVFYNKSNQKRINNVDSLSYLFGEKFILLPNLIYGDWDKGFE